MQAHDLQDTLQIRKILRAREGRILMEAFTKNNDVPMICDKLLVSLMSVLTNFTTAARSVKLGEPYVVPHSSVCRCRRMLPDCMHFSNDHCFTAKMEDLPSHLGDMMRYGAKFRYHLDKPDVLTTVEIGIQEYADKTIAKASRTERLNVQEVRERTAAAKLWIEYMQNELREAYDRMLLTRIYRLTSIRNRFFRLKNFKRTL